MSKFRYKQNDIVNFNVTESLSGFGLIVGVATVSAAVIGSTYMVKVLQSSEKIPNADYPFDTIAVPEVMLSCRQ